MISEPYAGGWLLSWGVRVWLEVSWEISQAGGCLAEVLGPCYNAMM
jgi:hypothetical protein